MAHLLTLGCSLPGNVGLYESWEMPSMAKWLAWHCHMSESTAREHVRIASALGSFPVISAAFGSGELSFSKVRAITRVATPAIESSLVDLAKYSTADQLRRIISGYRKYGPGSESESEQAERLYNDRSFTWYWDDEGFLVIHGRLPAEDAVLLLNALGAYGNEVPSASASPDKASRVTSRSNADALVEISRRSLTSQHSATPGAAEIVISADVSIFDPSADDDSIELSRVANGPRLAPETIRRLACNSPLRALLQDGGEPLSIGRRSRKFPVGMRRAIQARDGGCVWPGCNAYRYVDIHHIQWWSLGGETSTENGVSLCRSHHRAVHEGGYCVERAETGRNAFVFHSPEGELLASAAEQFPEPRDLRDVVTVKEDASASLWDGTTPDYSWVTTLLAHQEELSRIESVEDFLDESGEDPEDSGSG